MNKLEAIYWVSMIQQANEGDEEAQEMLKAEDAVRKQMRKKTVLEELQEMMSE